MTASALVTGEAVALDLRPAALPSRVVAALLDTLLQLVLLFLLLVLGGVLGSSSEAAAAAFGVVVVVVVGIGYSVLFETVLRGRTPGKAAMGLRVVRDDGGPIGFRQALVRGLAAAFLERPGITLFFGAIVCSLLNPQGKRIGDLMAGTMVLQERVPARGGQVATMPAQLTAWASGLDLTGLSDDLALQARQFVSRAPELTEAAREDLGSRLVTAVTEAVRPAPPPGTPGWAVLAAVLAERRQREESRLRAGQGHGTPVPPYGGGAAWGAAPTGAVAWGAAPTGAAPTRVDPPATPPAPPRAEPPPTGAGGFALPF